MEVVSKHWHNLPQTAINSYPSGSTLTQNPLDNSGVILN